MRAGTCVVESDLDIVPAGEKRHLTSKLVLEPTKAVAVDVRLSAQTTLAPHLFTPCTPLSRPMREGSFPFVRLAVPGTAKG